MFHVLEGACKRVGYMCAYTFLKINDYEIECDDEQADNFYTQIAQGKKDISEIAMWLKNHTHKSSL